MNWENFRRGARRDLERTKGLIARPRTEVIDIPSSVLSQDDLTHELKSFIYNNRWNFKIDVLPQYDEASIVALKIGKRLYW